MVRLVSMEEFYQKSQQEKLPIIDVREEEEFHSGHVPGAINMPLSTLGVTFAHLDDNQEYYMICQAGGRSQMACEFLEMQGLDTVNVMGGTTAWLGELE